MVGFEYSVQILCFWVSLEYFPVQLTLISKVGPKMAATFYWNILTTFAGNEPSDYFDSIKCKNNSQTMNSSLRKFVETFPNLKYRI